MTGESQDLTPFRLDSPGVRKGRMFRDAGMAQIAWMVTMFLAVCVSGVLHLLVPALVAAALFFLALPGEDGPFFNLPLTWWHGWRIKRHDNVVCEVDDAGQAVGGAMPELLDDLFVDDVLGQFATLYDESGDTDTVYWSTDGWEYANADMPQRHAAQMQEAAALKTAISQTDDNIAYGMMNGRRQFDPSEWVEDLRQNYLHEDFEDDSGLDAGDRRAKANLDKVFSDMVVRRRSKGLALIAVTVPRPPEWAKLVDSPEIFTVDQLRRSSLYRVLSSLERGLEEAGFKGLKLFGREQLFRYLFGAWNVHYLTGETIARNETSGYYQLPGADPTDPPQLGEDGRLVHVRQPFPHRVKVVRSGRSGRRYDTLQMDDGSYHFVVVVRNFRRKSGLPGATYPLIVGPHSPWIMHTQNCNTASQQLDKFLLRKRRNLLIGWFSNRRGLGTMYEELADRERVESERGAIDKIHISGSKPIRSDHRFTGSATSLEELGKVYDDLVATLRQEELSFYRVKGRARLFPAFLLAVLGPRL